MCRIMYLQYPKKVIKEVGEDWMVDFLEYLEKANGGHGNGIGGLFKTNGKKKFLIQKGLSLTHKQAVEIMKKYNWINGIMWHTRMASSGTISSEHNHPHTDLDHILILVHNGHISYADDYLRALQVLDTRYMDYEYSYYSYGYSYNGYYGKKKSDKKRVTDTWIMTNMLAKSIKLSLAEGKTIDGAMVRAWIKMLNHDAVIVQLYNGTVYLLVDRNDFEWVHDKDLGTIAVSEGLQYMGFDTIYRGSGVVKIEPDNKPRVIAGEFKAKKIGRKNKIPKNTEDDILKEEIEPKEVKTKCMELCILLYGDETLCKEVCKNLSAVDKITYDDLAEVIITRVEGDRAIIYE